MHTKHARNVGKSSPVKIIRREDEPLFGGKFGQRLISGMLYTDIRRNRGGIIFRFELAAAFGSFLETDQASLPSIPILILLRQNGPEPALKRPASRIRS